MVSHRQALVQNMTGLAADLKRLKTFPHWGQRHLMVPGDLGPEMVGRRGTEFLFGDR